MDGYPTNPDSWREHPSSPIVRGDAASFRPAGRVLFVPDTAAALPGEQRRAGKLYRLAMDNSRAYGESARAFEITALTLSEYSERLAELPTVSAHPEDDPDDLKDEQEAAEAEKAKHPKPSASGDARTVLIGPSGVGWNAHGMHHMDAQQLADGELPLSVSLRS